MSSQAKAPNNPGKPAPIKKIPSKISQEINFYDHQIEGIRWLAGRKSWILGDEQGLGKAQCNDEPVLTPTGWRPMGEIRLGDQVIGRDGKSTSVTGVFPQGQKEIFKVTFNDGSWTRVTADHLWEVRRRPESKAFVLTTAQLVDPGGEVEWYSTEGAVARTRRQQTHYLTPRGDARWCIPMVEPVQFEVDGVLPVAPYVLGAILGDGYIQPSGRINFASKTDIDWFEGEIPGLDRKSTRLNSSH